MKKKEEELNKYLTEFKYKLSNINNNCYNYDNQNRKNITAYNFKKIQIPRDNKRIKNSIPNSKLTSRSHNNFCFDSYYLRDKDEINEYKNIKTERNNNQYYFSYGNIIYKKNKDI